MQGGSVKNRLQPFAQLLQLGADQADRLELLGTIEGDEVK